MNNIVTYAVIGCALSFLVLAAAGVWITRNRLFKQRQEQAEKSCAAYEPASNTLYTQTPLLDKQ